MKRCLLYTAILSTLALALPHTAAHANPSHDVMVKAILNKFLLPQTQNRANLKKSSWEKFCYAQAVEKILHENGCANLIKTPQYYIVPRKNGSFDVLVENITPDHVTTIEDRVIIPNIDNVTEGQHKQYIEKSLEILEKELKFAGRKELIYKKADDRFYLTDELLTPEWFKNPNLTSEDATTVADYLFKQRADYQEALRKLGVEQKKYSHFFKE